MSLYFSKFPAIYYPIGNEYKLAVDILRRVKINDTSLADESQFIRHTVQDGDKPENLAARFYNSSNLHWVILLANNIINPYEDWPLPEAKLLESITSKYGEGKEYDLHHIEIVSDGTQVDLPEPLLVEDGEELLLETDEQLILYAGVLYNEPVRGVTNYEYEVTRNDQKRNILLLRPEFVQTAIEQLAQKAR